MIAVVHCGFIHLDIFRLELFMYVCEGMWVNQIFELVGCRLN